MTRDFEGLGLKAGDRIEPSPWHHDIGDLSMPMKLTCWRVNSETMTRHRNPLFGELAGMSIDNLGIDVMHTCSMGVYQCYLAELVWDLFDENCYSLDGPRIARTTLSIARMKEELWSFYRDEQSRGIQHTRVQQLLLTLFGTSTDRKCSLHAAETNGVFAFSIRLLELHGECLGPERHVHEEASAALRRIHKAMQDYPRKMPDNVIGDFCNDVKRHIRAYIALGGSLKPKHHFWWSWQDDYSCMGRLP